MSLASWDFSSHSTLSHFVNFTLLILLYYLLNFTKRLQKERKEIFFAYMAASSYRVMSKQVENGIFRHKWIYRHTCMRKQPHWQSSGIIIFLCKYYIIISNTLIGSLFDVLFLFLAVVLSEFHKTPRRNKDWVTEKLIIVEWSL